MFAESRQSTTDFFPRDWLGFLRGIFIEDNNKKRDEDRLIPREYETVEALLVALAGDYVPGGTMLSRILEWYKYTGEVFYMSIAKWKRQAGVSRSMIETAKKRTFPLIGVTLGVYPAHQGSEEVTHYHFNPWAFLRRLADVIKISPLKLARYLVENLQDPLQKSDKTLTKETMETKTKEVNVESLPSLEKVVDFSSSDSRQVEMLLKAGLSRSDASRFVDLPVETVQACIDAANEPRVRKRISYLLSALTNQLQESTNAPARQKVDYSTLVQQDVDDMPENFVIAGPEFRRDTGAIVRPGVDGAAAEAWRAASMQIALQYKSLAQDELLNAELVDFVDGEFVVSVRNSRSAALLQHRFYSCIQTIVAQVVKDADVRLRFEAPEKSELPFVYAPTVNVVNPDD